MPSTPTICNAEVISTYQPFSKRDSLKLETCISVLYIPTQYITSDNLILLYINLSFEKALWSEYFTRDLLVCYHPGVMKDEV